MSKSIMFFILFLSAELFAGQKIIKIATLNDYPPFCIAEENYPINQTIPVDKNAKGFKGYSWDIVKSGFHKMGYTIQLSISPWIRAMHYLKKKQVDVLFPTGKNKERHKFLIYSKNSINKANFLVYIPDKSRFRWNGLRSLVNLRLGMIRGYNFGDEILSLKLDKISLNSIAHGFKMMDLNRIDGFLGYEYNWDYYLHTNKLKENYKKLPVFGSSQEFLTALKSNRSAENIMRIFDEGIEKMRIDGSLKEIHNKWFGK